MVPVRRLINVLRADNRCCRSSSYTSHGSDRHQRVAMTTNNVTFFTTAAVSPSAIDDNCRLFDLVASTIIVVTLSTLGLGGNLTSFIVFCKYRTETRTMFLLRCLAFADFALVLFAVFIYSFKPIYPFAQIDASTRYGYDRFRLKVLWPLAMIAHTCTVWLTVLVTATRYCAVSQQTGRTPARLSHQLQVAIVVAVAVVYNMPRFFEHHPIGACANATATGTATGTGAGAGAGAGTGAGAGAGAGADAATAIDPSLHSGCLLGDNKVYQIVYCNVIYFAVMYIIPLLTLTYFNSHLVRFLKDFRKRRYSLTAGRHRDDHITMCIISIVFVFIFCQTPALINQIFWATILPADRQCGKFHYYYTAISDILVVLNSSVNFVIYCLFGKTFRSIFMEVLCKRAEPVELD